MKFPLVITPVQAVSRGFLLPLILYPISRPLTIEFFEIVWTALVVEPIVAHGPSVSDRVVSVEVRARVFTYDTLYAAFIGQNQTGRGNHRNGRTHSRWTDSSLRQRTCWTPTPVDTIAGRTTAKPQWPTAR